MFIMLLTYKTKNMTVNRSILYSQHLGKRKSQSKNDETNNRKNMYSGYFVYSSCGQANIIDEVYVLRILLYLCCYEDISLKTFMLFVWLFAQHHTDLMNKITRNLNIANYINQKYVGFNLHQNFGFAFKKPFLAEHVL